MLSIIRRRVVQQTGVRCFASETTPTKSFDWYVIYT